MNNSNINPESADEKAPPWHTQTTRETLSALQTDATIGLTEYEADLRLGRYGSNELPESGRISPWTILFAQFKNALIIILLIATAVSASLGHTVESIAITVIVLFAIILGFVQEYRAERAIEALRKMAAPTALVVRDGAERVIAAKYLVPGDIIVLHTGDRAPADARLVEAINLRADESALTGESVPVEKHTDAIEEINLPAGDRINMIHSGTVISYGRGRSIVVLTGMQTEFGKITGMLQTVEVIKTPLQKNLDRLGKVLGIVALAIIAVIVTLGFLRGEPLLQMLIFGIALAVAAVPEALPAVVTISLAIGVQRMVKKNALIRHLPTVEALGCASVICSDKTGTLTKGEMTVRKLFCAGRVVEVTGSGYDPAGTFRADGGEVEISPLLSEFLSGALLVTDAHLASSNGEWKIEGDPTEGALVVTAAKAGFDKAEVEKDFPRIDEIPFSSERKRMTTLHGIGEKTVAYSKGAPEIIVASCSRFLTVDGEKELNTEAAQKILDAAHNMANDAMRVLAFSKKSDTSIKEAEDGMVFLGLMGMIDPARPEVFDAINTCKTAGIKPVMITGDHPVTAKAIARELKILTDGVVVTGVEMDAMTDDVLEQRVEEIEVYARVSPEHKLRVVTAWQKKGKVVAMTGDGVNDAPALKRAEIGVAMGITGADVTKEASDMTLIDDNFTSIVGAIEEGRGIFSNIKKYLMYLLSSNIGEIGLMAGATLIGAPLPLTAVQILYVNLATDGLPALALAVDPPEKDLMARHPRNPDKGIFSRSIVLLMMVGGAWSMMVNLGLFLWAIDGGRAVEEAMALTFITLVLIQFCKAYIFRSDKNSAFFRPFANRWLNLAVAWELMLLAVIIYTPLLQPVFGTFNLSGGEWALVTGLAFTIFLPLEFMKWFIRSGWVESEK